MPHAVRRHISPPWCVRPALGACLVALAGVAVGAGLARPANAWQGPRPEQGRGAPPRPAGDAPALPDTPEVTLGYALGLQIGGQMAEDFRRPEAGIDIAALVAGLSDALLGRPPRIGEEKAFAALTAYEQKLLAQRQAFEKRMAEAAVANKAKGAEYLAANAAKRGVVRLPSGLQYEVLVEGKGPKPTPDDVVSTRYRGTHVDGTVFDQTEAADPPATVAIKGVVPGWQEALPLMKVGSKWRLTIPAELAYGERGSPPVIEPNEVLVFEIELLAIESPSAIPRP